MKLRGHHPSFEELKSGLQECINCDDAEIAHSEGDDILCEIALNCELTREQRIELIMLWKQIHKWYA